MKKYINWFLIPMGLMLVTWFAASLGMPGNRTSAALAVRFFYNPYLNYSSQQLMNNPPYRKAYERGEANWFGPPMQPISRLIAWDTLTFSMLLAFSVIGFAASLVIRAMHIYYEWKDGDKINWPWQTFLCFAVPAAYAAAMMAVIIFTPMNGQYQYN